MFETLEEARDSAEALAGSGDYKRVWIESETDVVERLEVTKAPSGWNRGGSGLNRKSGFTKRPR